MGSIEAAEDSFTVCRICLENNHSEVEIFKTVALGDLVANLIIDCADILVCTDEEVMPTIICTACYEKLIKSIEFRNMIRKSDKILREVIELNEQIVKADDQEDLNNLIHHEESELPEVIIKEELIDEENIIDYQFIILDESEEIIKKDPVIEVMDELEEVLVAPPEIETIPPVPPVEWKDKLKTRTIVPDQPLRNCCMCKKSFDLETNLLEHARNVHKIKPNTSTTSKEFPAMNKSVECKICLKTFRSPIALNTHQTNHSNLVMCKICGIMTTKQSSFAHKRIHKSVAVECEICHKMLKTTSGLAEHKKKIHGDEVHKCGCCPKVFANKIYLNRHMVTQHDPNRVVDLRYKCSQCSRGFQESSKLKSHMRIHTGEKPYKCNYCNASFTHNTDHRRHMWTHTGSPYACKKCNKSFDRPSLLHYHEAICIAEETVTGAVLQIESSGILCYECAECSERFTTESDFAAHATVHVMEA